MTRTILDRDLRSWEAYATSGDFGAPAPAKLGFRCTSDAAARPRLADFAGDKSDAERAVLAWPEAQLVAVLEKAPETA
jgi:hypothetical protein